MGNLDYDIIPDPEVTEEDMEDREVELDVVLSYSPFPQSSYSYCNLVANSFSCKYDNLCTVEDDDRRIISFCV